MNAWLESAAPLWRLTGWTMIHFLWIGAIVALVGGAVRVACRRTAPAVQYGVSMLTLAAIALAPLGAATWLVQYPALWEVPASQNMTNDAAFESRRDSATWGSFSETGEAPAVAGPVFIELKPSIPPPSKGGARGGTETPLDDATTIIADESNLSPDIDIELGDQQSLDANPSPDPSLQGRGMAHAVLDRAAVHLPWVWVVGAPLTFAWLAAGLVGSRRLRRSSRPLVDGPVADACRRLERAVGVTRRVALALCDGLAQPVLVGIVRPTILLPASAVTGWTPEELEMVLLHELAHVRRWDNLVNLIQRLVESLLFFHPAVWLVSRQVRRDREECCDALVVAKTQAPEAYASLLVSIAAAMGGRGRTKLAASSTLAAHPLTGRIRRILKLEDEPMRVSRSTLAFVLTLALSVIAAAYYGRAAVAEEDQNSPPSKEGARGGIELQDDADADAAEAEDEAKTASGGNVLLQDQPASAQASDVLAEVIAAVKKDLKKKLEELQTKTDAGGGATNFEEHQLPKLRNDIALYQKQLRDIESDLIDIEVLKNVTFENARSPAALDAAVNLELDKDPRIALYQQQLFDIELQISELSASTRNRDNAKLRRLEAQRDQTAAAMAQFRKQAEKEIRDRLLRLPNEALRAAITEYQVRYKALTEAKAKLEANLAEAEKLIADMSVGNPEAQALQHAIESRQELVLLLEQKIHELELMQNAGQRKLGVPRNEGRREVNDPDDVRVIVSYGLFDADRFKGRDWVRLLSVHRDKDVEIGWNEANNSMLVWAPRSFHDALQAFLKASRAKEALGEEGAAHLEQEGIRSTIRRMQAQLAAIERERAALSRLKALSETSASGMELLDAAVLAELERFDPMHNTFQEQLHALNQQMNALGAPAHDDGQAQLKRLQDARTKLAASVLEARETAEKEIRGRLTKLSEDALEAAINEALARSERLVAVKADIERKLADAQARIAATKVADPVAVVENQQPSGELLPASTVGALLVQLPKGLAEQDCKRIIAELKAAGHAARLTSDKRALAIMADQPNPRTRWRVVWEEDAQGMHCRLAAEEPAAHVDSKETPVQRPSAKASESSETSAKQLTAEQRARLNEMIKPGETAAAVFIHPVNGDVVMRRVKELNSLGHNVGIHRSYGFEVLVIIPPRGASQGPFLSLEDQKIADRAYKLLGLELEPLGKDDLERVKKQGFNGGLRIVGRRLPGIIPSDEGHLLVGLHVWPITDLKALDAVLSRDGLRELSPLKYYVVGSRDDRVRSGRLAVGPETKTLSDVPLVGELFVQDQVVQVEQALIAERLRSGKDHPRVKQLEQTLEKLRERRRQQEAVLTEYIESHRLAAFEVIQIDVAGTPPDGPITGQFTIELEGTVALGPLYGRVAVKGQTVREAEATIEKHLKEILRDPKVQVTLPRPLDVPAVDSPTPSEDADDAEVFAFPPSDKPAAADPTYLYDGKPFDFWRDLWKNELKIERRIEAIEALAAFGRAGLQKEAAEAILDVAGQYRLTPTPTNNTPEGRLNIAISRRLSLSGDDGISPDVWLPLLASRIEQDPEAWKENSGVLLRQVRAVSPGTRKLLLQLATEERYGPQKEAIYALYRSRQEADPEVDRVIAEAFRGGDRDLAKRLLELRGFFNLDKFSERIELLLDDNPGVIVRARQLLGRARVADQVYVADRMFDVLDDPEMADRHADAVRALVVITEGRVLPVEKNAVEDLRRMILARLRNVLLEGPPELNAMALVPFVPPSAAEMIQADALNGFLRRIDPNLSAERTELLKAALPDVDSERQRLYEAPPAE
jgi:beta-lactamase regulating signal transducer with metallopeptidase domain